MASKHELELFISEDGELKVHIKGIKGAGCLKVLDSLSKEIGEVREKNLTGEYYDLVKIKDLSTARIKKEEI